MENQGDLLILINSLLLIFLIKELIVLGYKK